MIKLTVLGSCGTYPGPGTMIGPAMVFAWRAAMDIAGHLDTTQMRPT